MTGKTKQSPAEMKAGMQMQLVQSILLQADLGAWSPEDPEYTGPWDGDIDDPDYFNQVGPEDWQDEDDWDDDSDYPDGDEEHAGVEDREVHYEPEELTERRREFFKRAEAQADVIGIPNIRSQAYRMIASSWKRWDSYESRRFLVQTEALLLEIDDEELRHRETQDLLSDYARLAEDQEKALELAQTIPSSVRKTKAMLGSWAILTENERWIMDDRLLELAKAEAKAASDPLLKHDAALAIAGALRPMSDMDRPGRSLDEATAWAELCERTIPSIKPKSKRDTRWRQLADWFVETGDQARARDIMAQVSNLDHRITFLAKAAQALVDDKNFTLAVSLLVEARGLNEKYNSGAKSPRAKQQGNYQRLANLLVRAKSYFDALELIDRVEDKWQRGMLIGELIQAATTVDPLAYPAHEWPAEKLLKIAVENITDSALRSSIEERIEKRGEFRTATIESVIFMFENFDQEDEEEEEPSEHEDE